MGLVCLFVISKGGNLMAYVKTTWVNGEEPALSADNLNKIENALAAHDEDIDDLKSQIAQGMPREVKLAMDAMFANMAVENDDVYSDEYAVFHAWATAINLESISAVFTQGANVVYDTDTLDSLKQYLVVTATYDDESTATVTTYTLSGSLDPGTSTITVSYDGKSTTFDVTVTERIDFTPSTYVVGTYGATAEGFTYDATSTKRLVENPIGITGLKNGCTYKASLNGNTTVGYGIGMYTFATVNPDDINRTVVEGTSKTISTDAMSYTSLGHTAWASDDCTFTWTGDEKSLLLVNFRNSGNTAITSANKTAVKNNFTLTKVTGE